MSSSPSLGMQRSKKFKHAILKNLLLGLKKGGAAASRDMSVHERKYAIRRAADAALAAARGDAPCWSRSLAAELSHGRQPHPAGSSITPTECKPRKVMICRRISRRRSPRPRPRRLLFEGRATAKAAGVARVVAMRRGAVRALREIVPGGRSMEDECTLLGETLDYAVSLKAQVDAMQLLLRNLLALKN